MKSDTATLPDEDKSRKYRHAIVVDDDPVIREVLRGDLLALNCGRVTVAESVKRARELLDREGASIDLIVSDLMMPEADGVELLGDLSRAAPTCPIVLMSAAGAGWVQSVAMLGRAYGLNVLGFLPKPFTLDRLADVLDVPQAT